MSNISFGYPDFADFDIIKRNKKVDFEEFSKKFDSIIQEKFTSKEGNIDHGALSKFIKTEFGIPGKDLSKTALDFYVPFKEFNGDYLKQVEARYKKTNTSLAEVISRALYNRMVDRALWLKNISNKPTKSDNIKDGMNDIYLEMSEKYFKEGISQKEWNDVFSEKLPPFKF